MKMKYFAAAVAALGSTTASAATLAELAGNVDASGWVSGSYLYNFNGEDNIGRATDIESNSFTLNQAVLNLSVAPDEGFGAGVMLLAGEDAATIVNPSYGENAGDKFSLPEAFVTYTTGALTVKAGRYSTLAGYEVLSDSANPLLSRSLQFPAAEPYFHTGVRLAFAASDATTFYLGVANSAVGGNATDNNDQKTVEFGVSTAFTEKFSLAVYDYYGVDPVGIEGANAQTNYLDIVASFAATDALSLALNFDMYSVEDVGDVIGIAGYASLAFSPMWTGTLRLESLEYDPDAGEGNTINAATIALGYTPAENFRLLFEGRIDSSDEDIYVDGSELTDTQPTLGVKAIYSYGM